MAWSFPNRVSTGNVGDTVTCVKGRGGRLTSRRPMSSFTAWSDDVFFRQAAESNALVPLSGQPTAQAGHMEKLDALAGAEGTEERVLALDTKEL